jgi:hypothetical protein
LDKKIPVEIKNIVDVDNASNLKRVEDKRASKNFAKDKD